MAEWFFRTAKVFGKRRVFLAFTGLAVLSGEPVYAAEPEMLDKVVVRDLRERLEQSGKLKDTIIKTEVVSDRKIERKQAKTLSDAVQNEPGISATTSCSICGIKRVQINGLKGEHTTVLVDDVPLHSTVSSFYGMDAMTTAGISRIEVARGAGASLLAPGAIGGTLNIITRKATDNSVIADVSAGNAQNRSLSVIGNAVSKNATRRVTVAAQSDNVGQWDGDKNGVSESPNRENHSAFFRFSEDVTNSDNIDLRVNLQRSDVLGGAIGDKIFPIAATTGTASFAGNDVRKAYTGPASQVTEAVSTQRLEAITRWTRQAGPSTTVQTTLSGAKQSQDSYYEGQDYANLNETYYGDVRLTHEWSPEWATIGGVDSRYEILRSSSVTFFGPPKNLPTDSFNHQANGVYIQQNWKPTDNFEVSGALRGDYLYVQWLDPQAQALPINRFLPVPRLHARWNHDTEFTSRFSLGEGYRAPLTFFESEHGIINDGFRVAITDAERSTSAVYSLAFDNKRTTVTSSLAWTNVRNLAYVELSTVPNTPAVMRTFGTPVDVYTADVVAGHQVSSNWLLGASYEHYFYADQYKSHIPVAAVEDRARLMVDFEAGKLDCNLTLNVTGARDLAKYGYGDRYNVYDDTIAAGDKFSAPKLTQSPLFATLDFKAQYALDADLQIYLGVKNLLDYTQAGVENPLFYSQAGKLNVTHIWGPLRGREVYAGIKVKL